MDFLAEFIFWLKIEAGDTPEADPSVFWLNPGQSGPRAIRDAQALLLTPLELGERSVLVQ